MDKKFDEKIIERLCNKIDNDNKKLGFKWKNCTNLRIYWRNSKFSPWQKSSILVIYL